MTVQSVTLGLAPEEPSWLTTADVARMLVIARQSVNRLCRAGELISRRVGPVGQRLYRLADVLAFVEQDAKARRRGRAGRLRALRLRMVKAELEPVQLSLFRRRGEVGSERGGSEWNAKGAGNHCVSRRIREGAFC